MIIRRVLTRAWGSGVRPESRKAAGLTSSVSESTLVKAAGWNMPLALLLSALRRKTWESREFRASL